jgi:hypothetical protein
MITECFPRLERTDVEDTPGSGRRWRTLSTPRNVGWYDLGQDFPQLLRQSLDGTTEDR